MLSLDECWEYPGARLPTGYGMVTTEGTKTYYAHRLMYRLVYGPIPKGQNVLHHCDNPACINPEHLYLGDQSQNLTDCVSRGRNKRQNTRSVHPIPGITHGTRASYNMHKCGCAECREAARLYGQQYYRRRTATKKNV